MDGDVGPLEELCSVSDEFGAYLIVDEAHATGVYGERGEGLVVEKGLCDRVLARIHTFGKAVGFRGGCVVAPSVVREHLINTARSFIYSTAPDTLSLLLIREGYSLLLDAVPERGRLFELIADFRRLLCEQSSRCRFLPVVGPIQGVVIPGNEAVCAVERALQAAGFVCRAIRAPTVPVGSERIRFCLHSFNTLEQLARALEITNTSLAQQEAA
jgi:8-amino-7-oxononanoate synthase